MGKKGGSAPAAPDPKQTAAAQTSTNIGTAIANNEMGNVNQVTPYGNLTYRTTGTYSYTDPNDGKTYQIPKYTATQTLSPEQEAILNENQRADKNLSTLAANQSGFLTDYMSKPVNLNNDAVEGRLMELGRKRLDPILAERQQNTEQALADKGIKLGSAAYDRAMALDTQGQNDAYNQLLLGGRQQAVQEALTQRNQPINEITALLSGSQVSQPNFVNTGQSRIPTTDVAGIINQDYQNRLGQWQQQQANSNAMMGGLFSLGGSLGSAAISNPEAFAFLSDVRAKKNIDRVGETNGMGLYLFHYNDEPDDAPRRLGLMAQEVAEIAPEAVSTRPDGMMQVDYAKALGGVH